MQKPHFLDCLTMNIKAHAAVYLTQRNILEDVNLQEHYCEDLKIMLYPSRFPSAAV